MSQTSATVIARYKGTCQWCPRGIWPGQAIVRDGGGWAHEACAEKATRAVTRLCELEASMLEHHNIALGCWGIPDGAKPTFSRRDWLIEARKRGVVVEGGEDEQLLLWWWRGILDRDLSD